MAKQSKLTSKCPPGTFCIENVTMLFIIVLTGILLYLIYNHCNVSQTNTQSSTPLLSSHFSFYITTTIWHLMSIMRNRKAVMTCFAQ